MKHECTANTRYEFKLGQTAEESVRRVNMVFRASTISKKTTHRLSEKFNSENTNLKNESHQ